METRVVITCALLVLCLWPTGGTEGEERGGGRGPALPCFGVECTQNHPKGDDQNDNGHNRNANGNGTPNDDGDRAGKRVPRLFSHPSPRARRQTVVVEVEEERSHRVGCTRSEERQAACLKGKCYALDLGHLRNPFCECPAMYEGARCEMLSSYYFRNYYAQLKKGAIIGGVVVGIILIIVAASIYCSYRKGRRRRKERKNTSGSGDTGKPKHETTAMIPDGESQV